MKVEKSLAKNINACSDAVMKESRASRATAHSLVHEKYKHSFGFLG